MIRLLLADGDTIRLGWIAESLARQGFQVVARASSGAEAVREVARSRPQVAAIAFELPDFSGTEATRRIMEANPIPVVLVMDREAPDKLTAALEGTRSGATTAVDAPPPPGDPEHEALLARMVRTLYLMHEVPVVKRRSQPDPGRLPTRGTPPRVVGIAASTGGPAAVQAILQSLPRDFPMAILLVQHMSDGFASALVNWLDRTTALRVVEAEEGQEPHPGVVYVAAGAQHLVLKDGPALSLLDGEPVEGHRPSATLFLQSMAQILGDRAVGMLLSGMGDDGVEGLLEIRRRGGVTLAQDEQTSVVYGMPREAVRRGAAQCSLSPPELAAALVRLSRGEIGVPPGDVLAEEPRP